MIGPAVERFRASPATRRPTASSDPTWTSTARRTHSSAATSRYHYERGRPGPEWPGQVVATLYPGLD